VSRQRDVWSDGIIKPDRLAKLEAIDFEFEPFKVRDRETLWDSNFADLKDLHERDTRQRDTEAPAAHTTLWIAAQRAEYRDGSISEEHVERLESIGFDFSEDDSTNKEELVRKVWEQNCEELETFEREHGHCNPYFTMQALKTWVVQQRKRKVGLVKPALSEGEIDRFGRYRIYLGRVEK
jgi:hypothetical protein